MRLPTGPHVPRKLSARLNRAGAMPRRTLTKARAHIRGATAVWFDVDEDAFEVIEELRLPKSVKDRLTRALRGRERAEAATEAALSMTREAAEALVRTSHLSTRDAAELLGLSPQRVQQVLAAAGQEAGRSGKKAAKTGP